MRKRLKKYEGQRLRFKGTFERFGTRNGRVGVIPTIVLRNVKLCGSRKVLTDHLWFNLTKEFEMDWQPFSGHFFQRLRPAFLNSTGLM